MSMEPINIEISELPAGEIRRGMRLLMRAVNQLLIDSRNDNQLEEEVKSMYRSLDRRLRKLEEMVENQDERPGTGDGESYVYLRDIEQLRNTVKTNLGRRFNMSFDDLRPLCGEVRDLLAAAFDNVERVNDQGERFGYTAPDEKHRDAVVIRLDGESWILDFCKDADGGGKLSEKLQWILGKETPWKPEAEGSL